MRLTTLPVNLGLALVYTCLYRWCYIAFLNREFGYVGYDLYQRDAGFLTLSTIVALAPVFCYHGVRGVSSIIAVMVYLALYVPIILTFALGSARPEAEIIRLQLTFMVGMCLLFLGDLADIKPPFGLSTRINLMPAVLAATALSAVYLVLVYQGALTFSSFGADLYVVRATNESLGTGLATRYISSWLSTVWSPLCMGYGLATRRHRYYWSGAAASLILYMAAADKIALILPVASFGLYRLLRNRTSAAFPVLTGTIAVIISILLLMAPAPGSALFFGTGILLNRTIGNGGQITMAYYDFFLAHPRTNFSHVSGLNVLTGPYPYGNLAVGQVVGQFYWTPDMNANANFWATDGIAAMGLSGVIVISIGCALFFVAVNSITRRFEISYVAVCFLPFVTILLNQSLFSSLWSGGAFFLVLFFLFTRQEGASAALIQRAKDTTVSSTVQQHA